MPKYCKHEYAINQDTLIVNNPDMLVCTKCGDWLAVTDLMKKSAKELMAFPKDIRYLVLRKQVELFDHDNPNYYQVEYDTPELRMADHIMRFGRLAEPNDCLVLAHELITEVINPILQEVTNQLEARVTELNKLLHHVHDSLDLQTLTSEPIYPKVKTAKHGEG